ncbi:MAG: hypothetical protein LC118_16980 [Dehalococcoidia bacterium]|nr:hypothetical protein [Dehalococcoidia bacterium]
MNDHQSDPQEAGPDSDELNGAVVLDHDALDEVTGGGIDYDCSYKDYYDCRYE